jgi:small subunit ribosomal protein S14
LAKLSSIEKNNRRKTLSEKHAARRSKLKAVIYDKNLSPEERFEATLKLAQMPRNGALTRVRNRCALSGRPRGFYRKFNLSRIAFRDMASEGMIPGVTKASW